MAHQAGIVTGLGKSEERRILIRGHDLIEELMGKITFNHLTWLMLMGRMPRPEEGCMIDVLLNVLVEHGMVSSVVSARHAKEKIRIAGVALARGIPWQLKRGLL